MAVTAAEAGTLEQAEARRLADCGAAGYFRGSAILLVAWIGAPALTRGITEIFLAFRLRSLAKQA